MSIQPKDSNTGGGETREESVKRMANDLLSKIPESFDKNTNHYYGADTLNRGYVR